jgi:predicted transcriptional regulator
VEGWKFLTNHAHVLLCISGDLGIRLRDLAGKVGITERAAQRIVADLIASGYLSSRKQGRRNQYEVNESLNLHHPLEQHVNVTALLRLAQTDRSEPMSGSVSIAQTTARANKGSVSIGAIRRGRAAD